ncbi:hypothetical protein GC207_06850 [bacterium]|nr:hypothetical protein [bacterium]
MKLQSTFVCTVMTMMFAGAGCATKPTVESRRQERPAAYQALSPDQKKLVDDGQIKVGMNEDAVYIAWGKPAQVLQSEDTSGHVTTWLYQGTTTDEYVGWRYVELAGPNGPRFARRLDRDFNTRDYVSAELVFRDGKLQSWRTLAKPPGNTYFRSP